MAAGATLRISQRSAEIRRRKLVEVIRPKAPRMAARLIDDVFDALDEQTVVVPGTGYVAVRKHRWHPRWSGLRDT